MGLDLDKLLTPDRTPIESLISIHHFEKPDLDGAITEMMEQSFYKDDRGTLKINDGIFARLYMTVNKMVLLAMFTVSLSEIDSSISFCTRPTDSIPSGE